MQNNGYIYSITCLRNLKEYIGQAVNVDDRWKAHYRAIRRAGDLVLHRAVRKYGVNNFALSIVWRGPVELLDEKERYYIDKFETLVPDGYNMTEGGEGLRGLRRTKTHNSRISTALKAFYASNSEARLALSRRVKGRPLSTSHRRKLSKAHKGRKLSEEHKAKLRGPRGSFTAAHRSNMAASARKRYDKKSERKKTSLAVRQTYTDDPSYRSRLWSRRYSYRIQ